MRNRSLRRDALEKMQYYQGDHWDFWTGPTVSAAAGGGQGLDEIRRVFQSCNFIEECIDRYVDALIGQFPTWYLKTADGDRADKVKDKRASELEVLLQQWIDLVTIRSAEDVNDGNDIWTDAVTAMSVVGHGDLRLWTPARYADASTPLERIHLSLLVPGQIERTTDDDGFLESLSYSYGSKRQLHTLDGDYLVVEGDDVPNGKVRLNLGGRWLVSFLQSRSLITPHVMSLQNGVNRALTMMGRNSVLAGFLERTFLNAQAPGNWIEDPITGESRFVPDPAGLASGGGIDTFVSGIPQLSSDGLSQTLSLPELYVREPVSPNTFLDEIEGYRTLIYNQFSQGHMVNGSRAAQSGLSRIESRQDFARKLLRPKRSIEAAMANTLTVVCRLLGYPEFQAVVTLNLNTGRLTADEQRAIIERYEKKLLSRSTAMALLGNISDPDAELQLILAEEQAGLEERSPVE